MLLNNGLVRYSGHRDLPITQKDLKNIFHICFHDLGTDFVYFLFSGPLSRFGPGGLLSSPGGSAYSTASSPSLLGPHPTDCIGPRGMVSTT